MVHSEVIKIILDHTPSALSARQTDDWLTPPTEVSHAEYVRHGLPHQIVFLTVPRTSRFKGGMINLSDRRQTTSRAIAVTLKLLPFTKTVRNLVLVSVRRTFSFKYDAKLGRYGDLLQFEFYDPATSRPLVVREDQIVQTVVAFNRLIESCQRRYGDN